MEEQKNENLPEEVQAENSTKEDNGEQEKASGRRILLWGLAGIYLLYTGFSLGNTHRTICQWSVF